MFKQRNMARKNSLFRKVVLILFIGAVLNAETKYSLPEDEDFYRSLEHVVCRESSKGETKQQQLAREATKQEAKGNKESAFRCTVHAARLKPKTSPKLWEAAAKFHSDKFSANCDRCRLLKLAAVCDNLARPSKFRIYFSHVECFQGQQNFSAAISALKQISIHMPNDTDAALQAGNMLAEMAAAGRAPWKDAESAFSNMHSWWTGSANSFRSAALVQTQLGDLEEAVRLFDRSLALHPTDEYTHSQALVACNQLGRYEDSLRHAEAAAALAPSDGEHRLSVGQAQVKLGRYRQALDTLRAARRLLPKSAAACVETGLAYMGAGDMPDAARWLRKAIRLGARDFKLWLLIAAALTRGGAGRDVAVEDAYAAAVRACRRENKGLPRARADEVCLLAEGRMYENMQRACNWTYWDRCGCIRNSA
jgi:tetratricopeptide (TPR) repeat protein